MVKRGFITLMTVLLLGAVVVTLTVSLLLMQIQHSMMIYTMKESLYASTYASNCAEEGLMQLALNMDYTGTSSLTLPSGSCTFVVTQGIFPQVDSTGTSGTISSKVRAQVLSSGVQWSIIP